MRGTHLPKERRSFWIETAEHNSYPALDQDIQVDIAVVGGGIAGILSAYSLAKADKEVALLEARTLLNGTTGFTTSKLSAQHQLIYDELMNRYDEEHARLFYEGNMEGIAYVQQITEKHQIDCHLNEQNAFVYTQKEEKKETFEKEANAYSRLNISGELQTELELNLEIAFAMQMNKQAEFQPVSFLQGVTKVIEELGGAVYEHSLVGEASQDDQGLIHLKTNNGCNISCNKAIFATHFPTFEPDDYYRSNTQPEMSYGLVYQTEKELLNGMYISDDVPKKTFRKMKHDNKHYILVGGQSHRVGDDKSEMDRYEEIDQFAKKIFGVGDALYRWSSHDYITEDRIPFIGLLHPDYPNIYTATGFCKWGLADAAAGSRVLTDLVLGKENRYTEMYNPRRDIPELSEENPETSKDDDQIEKLSIPDEVENLQAGDAAVIEKDDERIGVYKDEKNDLHYMDLACTHVGCDLQWNDGDKTWDCSCHGSRFDAFGRVIEGPALKDLKSK